LRLLLLTGSGGSGTTTLAAAIAVGAAARGMKTRLLAVDPAAAAVVLAADPDSPRIATQDVTRDAPQDVEALRMRGLPDPAVGRGLLDAARREGLLAQLGLDPIPPDLVGRLPGVDDLAVLGAVARAATDDPGDLVVADLGPWSTLLDLLALHDGLRTALRHGLSVSRRVDRAMTLPVDPLVAAGDRLSAELETIGEVLTAPSTSLLVLTRPGRVARAALHRVIPRLALFGLTPAEVVVNRADGTGGIDAADVGGLPVRQVPDVGHEPLGAAGLRSLLELAGELVPDQRERPPWGSVVEREEPSFVLVLGLPLAERAEVRAARLEDDLVVGVGERTRVLTLPSALRRCHVSGATLAGAGTADAVLRVRFEPDPTLWRS